MSKTIKFDYYDEGFDRTVNFIASFGPPEPAIGITQWYIDEIYPKDGADEWMLDDVIRDAIEDAAWEAFNADADRHQAMLDDAADAKLEEWQLARWEAGR